MVHQPKGSPTVFSRPLCVTLLFLTLVLTLAGAGAYPARADASKGAQLARQWCASCHVIGSTSTGPVPQGPPSFQAVARSGMTANQLRAFLSHPHGAMPDLSLTREEVDDLIAYINSLR